MAGKGVPAPQSAKSAMIDSVNIDAIMQNSSLSTAKTKQRDKREPPGSSYSTPTEYYSHQGRPPDPTALFCSPSAGSVLTKYYSTQGRPPDRSRIQ
eukprot:10155278-Ditylum_brightwellii.AAC.1